MWQAVSNWLQENRTWVFSGIGVAAIGAAATAVRFFLRRDIGRQNLHSGRSSQNLQTAGGTSQNVQVGGDINVSVAGTDERADPRLEHDRELFRRYDVAMTEQQLRDEIDGRYLRSVPESRPAVKLSSLALSGFCSRSRDSISKSCGDRERKS